MHLSETIQHARGEKPADLLLETARIVNVFSGEIQFGSIGVAGGVILGIGEYKARDRLDLEGRFVAPGFIDAHLHIESAMTCVSEFVRAVLPRGTTTMVADPHEIANVLGMPGIAYMIDSAEGQPANIYYSLPSCVPATDMETAGALLTAEDLRPLAGHGRIASLGEVMNVPGVIFGDPAVMKKLDLMRAAGKPLDGHSPGLSGLDLNAYLAAGIKGDHECTGLQEAREKLRGGMYLMIREGTAAKNLSALLPLVSEKNARRMMWCTDDRHLQDLMDHGSIDDLVRRAIRAGLDPVTAIQMATLNPAEYFGFHHLGGIAPGRRADLVVFSDLSEPRIETVYHGGVKVAEKGTVLPGLPPPPARLPDAMRVDPDAVDFSIPAASGSIRVIEIVPDQIVTRQRITAAPIAAGAVESDPERDLLKIAVAERHHGTGNTGLGFVRGMGFKRGAIAASVAHDSHNIILVGTGDADMTAALRRIVEMNGGLVAVEGGKILAELALPIAGLMSPEPMADVRFKMERLTEACRELGSNLPDPFMALSFLALPVIPELKITDRGLIDVTAFEPVPLFVP